MKEVLIVLYFSAIWCPPCRMMAPVLESVEKEYKGIKIEKIDIDREVELAKKYKIEAVPTLVFLLNGKEIRRHIGALEKEELKKIFEETFLPPLKEKIMNWAKDYAEKAGFSFNPQKITPLALSLIKWAKMYCPCRIREEENICPCVHHIKEIEEKGSCLCGLFYKK